jgi:hypothetical protein
MDGAKRVYLRRRPNAGGDANHFSQGYQPPKHKRAIARSTAVFTVAMLPFWYVLTRAVSTRGSAAASPVKHRTFTTNFSQAENPISEAGKWTNGQTDGLDWTDVRTTRGFAFGTELGGRRPPPQKYDDSTALLTGTWSANQAAEATVRALNPDDNINKEVELRLRSSLSPHKATGYEILFRASKSPNAYCEIVRWNGPLGDFTYLSRAQGPQCGVATGDVVRAMIVGSVITAYINGAQVVEATDNTYASGNPGIGFYLEGATGVNRDYGFTSFTASDE